MKNIRLIVTSQTCNMIKDRSFVLCMRSMSISIYNRGINMVYAPVLNSVGTRITIRG